MDELDIIPSASDTVWPPGPTRPDIEPLLPGEAEAVVAAAAAPRVIAAEWALWGKEANETSYHVLRCSKEGLREKDFSEIITRYSPGELDSLPQYTVSWIPGADREPEYIALGVHELAPPDPRQAGGRSHRDAAGRPIVFVRLFCLRYAQLAELVLTYQDQALGYRDLIEAVSGLQLPAGRTELVRVTLPDEPSPIIRRGTIRKQAEQVATMLLTGRQICVLGADDIKLAERLQFVDTVMAVLPYGLRATMSAATSASSTSQDLKLRLFFASVPRAGGRLASGRSRGEDFRVKWGKLDEIDIPDQVAGLYRQWLNDVKGHAPAMLADQVVPVRFAAADIRRMVGNLPEDKSVQATLEDLGTDLRAADLDPEAVKEAVKDATKRLRRYLGGEDQPAAPVEIQHQYRQLVCWRQLLVDDGRLSPQLKGPLYDQLLRVAFGPELTYDGFCDIEGSVGFPLHTSLRTALAKFPASGWLAYLLAREGQPGFRGERWMDAARQERRPVSCAEPLDAVITAALSRRLGRRHGAVTLDWAIGYLARYGGGDLETLLAGRGYLTWLLEYIYGDDLSSQVSRLRTVLGLAFGDSLTREDIDRIFGNAACQPTAALRQAVIAMTRDGNRKYAQQAFLRAQGASDQEIAAVRGTRLTDRLLRQGRRRAGGTPTPLPPLRDPAGQPWVPDAFKPGEGRLYNPLRSQGSPWNINGIAGLVVLILIVLAVLFAIFQSVVIPHVFQHGAPTMPAPTVPAGPAATVPAGWTPVHARHTLFMQGPVSHALAIDLTGEGRRGDP